MLRYAPKSPINRITFFLPLIRWIDSPRQLAARNVALEPGEGPGESSVPCFSQDRSYPLDNSMWAARVIAECLPEQSYPGIEHH